MIDYQAIIEELRDDDVFRLLDELGAEPVDKAGAIICKTVCHNEDAEDASHKLYYYKNTHLFYCFTECGAMSIFKFLRQYYQTRQIEYDWYNDIYQVILSCSASNVLSKNPQAYKSRRSDYEPQKVRKELPTLPNGLVDSFLCYYPDEWLNDSITDHAMSEYNIRFSPAQNKIIIPHYNANSGLVGIRGRALDEYEIEHIGKYTPVWIEGKCYSHPLSLNLYGLNQTKDAIRQNGVAWIFEAEKSCLQVEGFKMPNLSVASCGSNLNKYQIDLLLRHCAPREIVVCYDNEELAHEEKYFNKLYRLCQKYSRYCQMSFIYDREKILPPKASPSDCGEEVFRHLLDKRIKV